MNNTLKSIGHGFVSALLFAIPFALSSHSSVFDLTIGGVLTAFYHYLLSQAN